MSKLQFKIIESASLTLVENPKFKLQYYPTPHPKKRFEVTGDGLYPSLGKSEGCKFG
jgi:hypothetical protein